MAKGQIKIKGLVELLAKLNGAVQILTGNFRNTAEKAGLLVEREAKKIITDKGHVDTGNLRSSIATIVEERGLFRVDIIIGTDVYYSVYVEALPDGGYLFPAYLNKREEAIELLRTDLERALEGK